MAWLWGKKEMADVEENLVKGRDETGNGTAEDDDSCVFALYEADSNDADDTSNGVGKSCCKCNNESDNKHSKREAVYFDKEESSDESFIENSSVSEYNDEDDDDSLVVNLIESMTTGDETSDDDVSKLEANNNVAVDTSFDSYDDNDDVVVSVQSPSNEGGGTREDKPENGAEKEIQTTRIEYKRMNDKGNNNDKTDNDDPVASFWEKQSLLVLAAEHDRVDILKNLLKDEDEEKEILLNSGIPPLHLAISFGSVSTAQSLLRMGADPSVRPNIDLVLEERRNQPEDSKVDIPNIHRFQMITAWELAFGNSLYGEKSLSNKSSTSSSLFGSTTTVESDGTNSMTKNQIIKPVDMAPSKREGIRHAFTAEALRSVGNDEVERLKQLLKSGMPANIDIMGKGLHAWSVEMGCSRCAEYLQPVEAAKYYEKSTGNDYTATYSIASQHKAKGVAHTNGDLYEASTKDADENNGSASFVVHRPDAEETIPQLKNRLDELESLSVALSICLDNLAEEVSVCHGLLLMGGGASALASHVRSLRDLKAQKSREMEDAQFEYQDAERELKDLMHSTGDVGREIAEMAATNILSLTPPNTNSGQPYQISESSDHKLNIGKVQEEEGELEKLNIKARIAASANKNRKLRASIADISEESARDLKEVKSRGLEGGINLVRGLREEIRDLEYHFSEARSLRNVCKAKISMILERMSNEENSKIDAAETVDATTDVLKSDPGNGELDVSSIKATPKEMGNLNETTDTGHHQCTDENRTDESVVIKHLEIDTSRMQETPKQNDSESPGMSRASSLRKNPQEKPNFGDLDKLLNISASTKIVTGESQAIAIIQPGNKGFFTVDLWEVLLRIIGYERAANRRSVQNATKTTSSTRPNVMII